MKIASLLLAQLSSGEVLVPDKLPEVLWGAWDLSGKACVDDDSLTRVEFGPNWMRDNLGLGILQFHTAVVPMRDFDEALEARFLMGGDGGLRDQQVLLNISDSEEVRRLLWSDSQGPGHIDDTNEPIELVDCTEERGHQ